MTSTAGASVEPCDTAKSTVPVLPDCSLAGVMILSPKGVVALPTNPVASATYFSPVASVTGNVAIMSEGLLLGDGATPMFKTKFDGTSINGVAVLYLKSDNNFEPLTQISTVGLAEL